MDSEGRVEVIDLDLNEEPTEPYRQMSSDMENVYSRIEERIRRLEAVTVRARQRQEWRLAREALNEDDMNFNGEIEQTVVNGTPTESLNPASQMRVDGLKSSNSHLLALALESDADPHVKKNSGEAFFDCNICLGKARDPILTCCGHLYCWPCFYQLDDVGPDTKECPACKGEVKDTDITPIYGSSDKALKLDLDKSGLKIPPRPQARRIESLRQQRITRGSHSLRIEEVLRGLHSFSTLSSNLSSALSSAERIVEDLEGMAHMYPPPGRRYRVVIDADSNANIVVDVPSEAPAPAADANADAETGLPSSSASTAANGTTSAGNSLQPDVMASLPRRVSPRRRIHSQGRLADLSAGRMPRRSSLRSRIEQQAQLMLRNRTEQEAQQMQPSRTEREAQLRNIFRRTIAEQEAVLMQRLSAVDQSEEHPPQIDNPELLPVRVVTAYSSNVHNNHETASATPETNMSAALPSSSRRRADASEESSDSGSPEPRRRRLR
uniref:E3 ubiquitin-protein ligase RMA n=1 Tax=Kalanchoe fedtschenkoi TaxID=63787 RepID=A0A7N0UBV6_KALFE